MFSWLFKFIAGIFAASIGALIGALLERRVVTPQVRQVAEDSEAWGSLHASPIHIKASDEV